MSDVTKLPKWAQAMIKSLERRVSDQAEHIKNLKGEAGETNIFAEDYMFKIPLPKDASVIFGDVFRVSMSDNGKTLKVMDTSCSRGDMHIKPLVSNVIEVKIGEIR